MQRIAHYDITAKLGEGGMGEVYRATDTKLGREVALKILPEQFAADAQRLARFQREAQVLAALNHPNIGAIYGLESEDDRHALVLELVEGPTLADRIDQGPVGVTEAIPIALQIAEALEAAHEKGVIHRDLKPANIKVTPDRQVKVLDFGLAKAMASDPASSPDLTQSPTLTMAATQAGLILGTAGYMSPEQAAGQPVDKRTDIWAFAVVLFEMLTGQRLFAGETVSHTMAAVLQAEIDLDRLPPSTPHRLRQLLGRCLQRDLPKRLRDIGDARLELEEALADPAPTPATAPRSASALPWVLAIAACVAGLGLGSLWGPEPAPVPLRKSSIALENPRYRWNRPVISPDGARVAYTDHRRLYVRDLAQLQPRLIREGASHPFWSPDGSHLGFLADEKIWKLDIGTAEPVFVCDWEENLPIGLAWGADNRIVISKWRGGLYKVSAGGGEPAVWVDVTEDEVDFHDPAYLPEARTLIAGVHPVPEKRGGWIAISPDGTRQWLGRDDDGSSWGGAYSSSGHLIEGDGDNNLCRRTGGGSPS